MLGKIIKMELLSDLCPASGDGFAGFVDTDVCFDDKGLPFIPAKRLKGVLRECALDILSVDAGYASTFDRLFGETGKLTPGTLNVESGRLVGAQIGDAHRSELAEVYTNVRSRTKMENGIAAEGTLRTARVLNRGQVYEFLVTLDEESLAFFEMCVKSLRSMGLNRSRGLGEVKCYLQDAQLAGGQVFAMRDWGEKKAFSYNIELLDPVIAAERSGKPYDTEDYIFGSGILGAFAVKYIEKRALSPDDAYEDKEFKRIFLDGGVIFSAALPCQGEDTYYPAPAVLKTNKLGTRLSDESLGISDETDNENPICKRLGGFVSIKDGVVRKLSVSKTTSIHHARPVDRSKGHATGDKDGGELFTYEAISAGQTFAGSVIGEASDIAMLAGLFAENNILRLGRSRTAQYGKAKITAAETIPQANVLPLKSGDLFRIVALTPVILENKSGVNTTNLTIVPQILGCGIEIVRSCCSETIISGYYGKWLLPKRQERALAEGSTIVMKYTGADITLSLNFIGKRTGEGFGRIRLESVPEANSLTNSFTFAPDEKVALPKERETMAAISKLRAEKEAVSTGGKYGDSVIKEKIGAPVNSGLARIVTALNASKDFMSFAKKLEEIKQAAQLEAALAFATQKPRMYFRTNATRLETTHIVNLLKGLGYDYHSYKKFLNAAIQRIKQIRRMSDESKSGKGGEFNARG
ncbi:MAG: hypothetical protein LBL96_03695 [Clostridiales bacterium]|nr:hypothetical protein [Clostridiales bacterium]